MNKADATYRELSRRPIYALAFLAPLLIGYELGGVSEDRGLLAEKVLRELLSLSGVSVRWLSGLFLVTVLLAWQIYSEAPWRIRPMVLVLMAVEAIVLTLPLFLLHALIPRSLSQPPKSGGVASAGLESAGTASAGLESAGTASAGLESAIPATLAAPAESPPTPPARSAAAAAAARQALWRDIVISLGAGPYEELIFRLFLVELLLWLMMEGVGADARTASIVAVLVSATLFAGYHHLPGTAEPFTWGRFLFRTGAGVYFSLVFLARGYAITAGSHSGYDVLVDLSRRL